VAQGNQAEWDRLVAAARAEGALAVFGPAPEALRNALLTFSKQYPEIQLEYTGGFGRVFVPRILAEREADQYSWDVQVGGSGTAISEFVPRGVLDPIRPALVLPEVLDDSKWRGGFDAGFQDTAGQFIYAFQGSLVPVVFVNRDVIPESELGQIEQLIDPKWQGKIGWDDPRTNGVGSTNGAHLLSLLGRDFMTRLLEQDVVILTDQRQLAERLVRGSLPIAIGVDLPILLTLQKEGLGQNVKPLALDSPAGARVGSFWGNATLINRAPHPNAARLFLNWLLSREGQVEWVQAAEAASRRLDVPAPEGTLPGPQHRVIDDEPNFHFQRETTDLAKELLK
jgi:iron(III) transport system substrate-binding protein